jgi:hypothetical protein
MHRKRLVAMGGFGKASAGKFCFLAGVAGGAAMAPGQKFFGAFFKKAPLAFHFAVP